MALAPAGCRPAAAQASRPTASPAPARRGARSRSTSGAPTPRARACPSTTRASARPPGRQFYIRPGRLRGLRDPVPAGRGAAAARARTAASSTCPTSPAARRSCTTSGRLAGTRSTTCGCRRTRSPRSSPGKITNWNEPGDRGRQPGAQVPQPAPDAGHPLRRLGHHRQAGRLPGAQVRRRSGTRSPGSTSVTLPVQFWPNFPGAVAVRGSDGVANYVSNTSVGHGLDRLRRGRLRLRALDGRRRTSRTAAATTRRRRPSNVAIALRHATLNPDLTQNLLGRLQRPRGGRLSAGELQLPDHARPPGFDPAKGAVLGKWIIYIACAGQKEAAPLGYSPLPPNLVKADFQAVAADPGSAQAAAADTAGLPQPDHHRRGRQRGPAPGRHLRRLGRRHRQTRCSRPPPQEAAAGARRPTRHSGGKTTGKTKTPAKHSGKTTVTSPLLPNAGVTITPLSSVAQAAVLKEGVKEASAAVRASDSPLLLAEVVAGAAGGRPARFADRTPEAFMNLSRHLPRVLIAAGLVAGALLVSGAPAVAASPSVTVTPEHRARRPAVRERLLDRLQPPAGGLLPPVHRQPDQRRHASAPRSTPTTGITDAPGAGNMLRARHRGQRPVCQRGALHLRRPDAVHVRRVHRRARWRRAR